MNGAGSTPGDNFSATANIPLDQKLEDAIARGNLVTPPGENAYAYYQQLQSSGAKANVLARFNEKLMPLLTPRADEMIERITQPGNSDFTPAEWDEAARLSAWASKIKPNDKGLRARADYCLGRVAYLEKRADDALNLWQRASETDPAWAVPTNGVGLVYNEKKEYATARQYLHEAVRRNPNWAYPYNNIGTSYFYEKNYDQAEIYYRQAVERSPQWARPHAWLGDIAMHRKDYLRAAEEYQAVLDLAQSGAGANIDLNVIETKLARARQLVSQ
jgi:tetratricopeptide (TPR) repeat protein